VESLEVAEWVAGWGADHTECILAWEERAGARLEKSEGVSEE
jgi:hypothetical protein